MATFLFWTLVAIVFVQRLVEQRINQRNCQRSRASGAQEFGAAHYRFVVVLHLAWYLAWITETWLSGLHLSPYGWIYFSLFLAAEMFRYWSIASLGSAWTTHILAIPGAARVRRGPYRWFRHPNYGAVVIELFCIPMIFGAWRTAAIATVLYLVLLIGFRIPAENQALKLLR